MMNALIHDFPTHNTAPSAPPSPVKPKPEPRDTEISYNPQDETVMSPGTIVLGKVTDGPSVPKARTEGRPVQPQDGRYVFETGDRRFHTAVTMAAVGRTIEILEKALGEPIKWAFSGAQLGVVADGGDMLNAYYSRDDGSLNFFHATDKVTGKVINSGDSGEVVAHEAGHAILDGLRPGYFSTWSVDPAAFHESFGDVVAMLVSLQDERTLDRVAEQTGGDLTKPNVIADLGEQLGDAINHEVGRNVTGGSYVRTARNSFVWEDPSTLPESGGPNRLGSESHSFSRLWTGAFYDVLNGITKRNLDAGMSPKEALRAAGEEGLKVTGNLFKTAPQGDFAFRDMAAAMVRSDERFNGGKNAGLMREVFEKRKIMQPAEEASIPVSFKASVQQPLEEATRPVRVTLRGEQFGMFAGAQVETRVDRDGSLAKVSQVGTQVRKDLERLIAAGRIKYADPGQKLTTKDLVDAHGRPYMGVVTWLDGQMKIERVHIAD